MWPKENPSKTIKTKFQKLSLHLSLGLILVQLNLLGLGTLQLLTKATNTSR
jgi:hypothetical protein